MTRSPISWEGNFLFTDFPKVPFQIVDKFLDEVHADVQFLACFADTGPHLLAIENFPTAIFFDDHDGNFFNVFVGGEAPGTAEALPAAPDYAAVLADT
jgi:hypothetical protein